MKNTLQTTKQMIIAGVLAVLCCIGLLLVSSFIPQKSIEKNAKQSSDYFLANPLFESLTKNQSSTKRDNYADCISADIAWQLGNGTTDSNVFERVLEARYTQEAWENVNSGFHRAVYEGAEANRAYSRYWHGNAAVIRLLYPVLNVTQMRIVFMVLGIVLTLAWTAYLVAKKEYVLAIPYLLGAFAIKVVFSYLCFEYAFVSLLVPVFSFLAYRVATNIRNRKEGRLLRPVTLFFLAGILTCFFDFLTAETLTFTIPAFVFFFCLEKKEEKPFVITTDSSKEGSEKSPFKMFLSIGFGWMAGYAGMFLLKWLLTLIVFGKEEFVLSLQVAAERSVGAVHETQNLASPTVGFAERVLRIISRNFACLFGLSDNMSMTAVWVVLGGIVAAVVLLWFFLRKSSKEKQKGKKATSFFPVYLILMLLPIGRFLVLSNHAYMHYFFTYRALMITVSAGAYLFIKTTVVSNLFTRQNPPRRGSRAGR